MNMGERTGDCLGFEVLGVGTDLTTVQTLANLPVDGFGNRVPAKAIIQCALTADAGKGAVAVRWKGNGDTPTATDGMQLAAGGVIEIDSGLANLKFIGVAANAKLLISYYAPGCSTRYAPTGSGGSGGGGGSGTVTSVSVATANGFSGTVATDTTTPAITIIAGNITPTTVAPTGITGAVAASRDAGGIASGAPTTGTFLKGDKVTDQTGMIWICTVAGSPGTWVSKADTAVTQSAGNNTTKVATTAFVQQEITSSLNPAAVNLGSSLSGVVNLDLSLSNAFYGTVTGTITQITVTNVPSYRKSIDFILTQDGTGGRDITTWTGIKSTGGSQPHPSGAASSSDLFTLKCVNSIVIVSLSCPAFS